MEKAKTVLITGGNKGIGFETARRLGKMGFVILLGARDEKRGQEAVIQLVNEEINAHFIPLDVTVQETIHSAAVHIDEQYGSLDVLINNAGVSLDRGNPPSQLELSQFKRTYDVNVFGMFSVTKAFLPLIKQAPAGRIVNLSSGLASLTLNSDPKSEFYGLNLLAYMSSKTAVNALTVLLAKELRETTIKVNSADPGFTSTDLNGHRGYRSVEQAATIIVELSTLANDGPSGGFFDENGVVSW